MPRQYVAVRPERPEGLRLYLHADGYPWYFRLTPVRDPEKPQHWRILVEPCTAPRLHTANPAPVAILASGLPGPMPLRAMLDAIEADPMAWLEQHENRVAYRWIDACTVSDPA